MSLHSLIADEWDALLTSDEVRLIGKVGEFVATELVPFATAAHRTGEAVGEELIRRWASLGLQGSQSPKERGGQRASYLAKIRVVQVLARHAFAAAFSLNDSHSMVYMFATQASEPLRVRYLSGLIAGDLIACVALAEDSGGSDLAAMRTTAKRVAGGWLFNGTKAWITNATVADLAVVGAQNDAGTAGIARFVVELNGQGVTRLGAHGLDTRGASGVHALGFADAFVPMTKCFKRRRGLSSLHGRNQWREGACGIHNSDIMVEQARGSGRLEADKARSNHGDSRAARKRRKEPIGIIQCLQG